MRLEWGLELSEEAGGVNSSVEVTRRAGSRQGGESLERVYAKLANHVVQDPALLVF